MDRVRRTLRFASVAIALPAIYLNSSFLQAQQPKLKHDAAEGKASARIIRQVAANETVGNTQSGLLNAFAQTSSSSNSAGLLGALFGTPEPTPQRSIKHQHAKTGTTSKKTVNSAVPLPPSLPSASKSTGVKSNPSLKATTQDSTPDWNGIPYHSPIRSEVESGSVPLMDPDPSTLARQSQSAGPLRRPTTSPPTQLPQLPPETPNPVPTAVQSLTPPRSQNPVSVTAKASTESARRSSRRTASTQMTGDKLEANSGSVKAQSSQSARRAEIAKAADLVPKVARKPLSDSSKPLSPAKEESNASVESADLVPKKVVQDQATEETMEVESSEDLQPLPPATLPAEGNTESDREQAEDDGSEDPLQVTAASHRAGAESETEGEEETSLESKQMNMSSNSQDKAGEVNQASDVVSPEPTSESVAAVPDRLQSEPVSGSNDLRGQTPPAISGVRLDAQSSEAMQLSPPTTPDFGVNSPEEDGTNQMRGQGLGLGRISGTTSELPGIRVTTKGPEAILIRQNADYEILVENRGQIDAEGVLIRALVPEWADLRGQVASRGEIATRKEGSADRLVWEIGQLPAGKSETMKLQLIASRSGNYDLDIDWTLIPQKSVARVQVREPRLNLTIEGPDEVVFGESQTYKVRVLNPGNGTASNVVFTLSPNSATPQSQKIGDIPPGKEAQFDIELTAKDHGDLKIHGLAAGDLSLRADAEKTIKVSAAKLEAVLTGPQVKYQNTEGAYSLQIQNHGDAASDQIVASLRLPAGVRYLGGIEGATQQDQLLSWNLDELSPGAILTYQFQCNMDATGEHLFSFDCRGSAAGAAAVSIATRVESIADLVLSVSDPVAPAPIGTDVPYEIVIRNRGSKEATDVRAIAQFSHGVEPHRIEGQSGQVMTGQVLFDPIPRIGAGEEVRMRVIAQADRAGHHRFRAEIRSGDTVLVAEEATHYMSPEGERVSRRSSERLRR